MVDRTTPIKTEVIKAQMIANNTHEISIKKPAGYTYEAGQYLGIRIPGVVDKTHEHADQRFFSPLSAPSEPDLRFVTRLRDSAFKKAWRELKPGSVIEISEAIGDFTIENFTQPLVVLAGGVGIAPFRSLVVELIAQAKLPECHIFHVNRTIGDIVYDQEFFALANSHKQLHYQPIFTRQTREDLTCTYPEAIAGLLEVDLIKRSVKKPLADYEFLVAGSHPFSNDAMDKLQASGVEVSQIRYDRFCGYYG